MPPPSRPSVRSVAVAAAVVAAVGVVVVIFATKSRHSTAPILAFAGTLMVAVITAVYDNQVDMHNQARRLQLRFSRTHPVVQAYRDVERRVLDRSTFLTDLAVASEPGQPAITPAQRDHAMEMGRASEEAFAVFA